MHPQYTSDRPGTAPCCGMDVGPAKSERAEHRGKTYYFCTGSCKKKFQKEPERYLERSAGAAERPGDQL